MKHPDDLDPIFPDDIEHCMSSAVHASQARAGRKLGVAQGKFAQRLYLVPQSANVSFGLFLAPGTTRLGSNPSQVRRRRATEYDGDHAGPNSSSNQRSISKVSSTGLANPLSIASSSLSLNFERSS